MNVDPDHRFATARHRVYSLLAAVFDGDVDLLESAIDADVFVTLAASIPDAPAVDPLRPPAPDRSALTFGYDALFVVPGGHYVPPFASGHVVEPTGEFDSDSIHREEDGPGELLGSPAARAAGTYEQFEFTPTLGTEFPDSLPAMFEFVATLAAAESDASADAVVADLRATQLAFIEEQLSWIDVFADAVAENDGAEGMYATLAQFASAFVAYDREQLAGMDDEGDASPFE